MPPSPTPAVFKVLLGMSPREVDIQVVPLLGATPVNLAEYICEHWLGEPDEPTLKCIEQETDRIFADNVG
jgi:hypothetical protein